MTKNKKNIILFIAFIIIASAAAAIALHSNQDERLPVDLKAIKTNDGWGYEITVDKKLFIRQTSIPAVGGNMAFTTKDAALLVGKHAVEKLVKGKLPQITVQELKDWGVVKNTSVR